MTNYQTRLVTQGPGLVALFSLQKTMTGHKDCLVLNAAITGVTLSLTPRVNIINILTWETSPSPSLTVELKIFGI